MKTINRLRHWAAAGALVLLTACAAVPSTTFNDKVAVAVTTVSEVRRTTAAMLDARVITVEDAETVRATTDAARASIDVARKLGSTDQGAAVAKLEATATVLKALQQYLATKGVK